MSPDILDIILNICSSLRALCDSTAADELAVEAHVEDDSAADVPAAEELAAEELAAEEPAAEEPAAEEPAAVAPADDDSALVVGISTISLGDTEGSSSASGSTLRSSVGSLMLPPFDDCVDEELGKPEKPPELSSCDLLDDRPDPEVSLSLGNHSLTQSLESWSRVRGD